MDESVFAAQYAEFLELEKRTKKRFVCDRQFISPQLGDDGRSPAQYDFSKQYLYHLGWAARILSQNKPRIHYDYSSSSYFAAIASAWVPIRFHDFSPRDIRLSNLTCQHANLQKLNEEDNSLESVSCMHVLEHVGLGRYGDPLDYDGDLKALSELTRIVRPGGTLLIVVPVHAMAVVQFNNGRVYGVDDMPNMLKKDFHLVEKAVTPIQNYDGLLYGATPDHLSNERVLTCACYHFIKR